MTEDKAKQALAIAKRARATAHTWIDLHNALYGIGGKLGALFPAQSDRIQFCKTAEYGMIARMIDELRDAAGDPPAVANLTRKANGAMNIRVPKSIHAALLAEADAEGVSLNQLCLSKLCVQLRAAV